MDVIEKDRNGVGFKDTEEKYLSKGKRLRIFKTIMLVIPFVAMVRL